MSRVGIVLGLLVMAAVAHAQQINWFCEEGFTNRISDGAAMDGAFQFELGVFEGDFEPSSLNMDQWAANWRPAQRTEYDESIAAFDAVWQVESNEAPFTVGKPVYIWGWRVGPSGSEWILLTNTSWTWLDVEDIFASLYCNVADATAIIGEIDPYSVSFLMKSAAVTGVASPPTSWLQWQAKALANESLNSPHDDPDQDGAENLLEFVFGTDPKTAKAPVATPISFVTVGPDRFLQITIPRRIDHTANLFVEVSSDMQTWHSGPAHTETVADDVAALVVRDLTPLSPAAPKRFMRLRAVVP